MVERIERGMSTIYRDSLGVELVEYGFLVSEADLCFFVCLDSYGWVGRMLHVFTIERAKQCIRKRIASGLEPVSGSKGWGVSRTGRGYILLWVVGPFLINGAAVEILNAWGFEAMSILTWAKYDLKNNHGYGGVGFWLLGNAEFCIIAKRSSWPSIRTGRSSLIIDTKRRHSQKPEAVHELCEQRFPGPYLEVFGRRERAGWVVLGDEAPGDLGDVRESLRRFY